VKATATRRARATITQVHKSVADRSSDAKSLQSGILVEAADPSASEPEFDRRLVAMCLIFPILLTIWFSFDNSWPFWDAADHLRVEFQYADSLRHARPWNLHWIKDFLTVNYCYPATVHIFNGLLKAVLGSGRWVDSLSLIFFSIVLSFSTCGVALMLLKNRAAAALSVMFLNIYPCVALLSHIKLLDYPHLAMFTTAMYCLLRWQRRADWTSALICGTALGLACTTKQIAAFFLFMPCLLLLIQNLRKSLWRRALQLTTAGLMVVAFLAIWVIPNAADINAYMHRNSGHLGSRTMLTAFIPNLSGYANCAPGLTGFPLLWLFFASLISATRSQLRDLALPAVAAISGIICMSALPFQLPEHRYIANALLFPALLCAAQITRWWQSKNYVAASMFSLLAATGVLQFAVLNFTPYPAHLDRGVAHAIMGTDNDRRGPLEPGFNPTPPGDQWGQKWIVEECKKASNNQGCWLNMLPSTPELSVHTIALISRYEGSNVRPTTTRLWTPTGDRIDFGEDNWKNFHFYLIKSGQQGLQFESKQSEANYKRLEDKIQNGSDYKLLASRTIADGTLLRLFIRSDFAGVRSTKHDTAGADDRISEPKPNIHNGDSD
jgi:hypothetical protein